MTKQEEPGGEQLVPSVAEVRRAIREGIASLLEDFLDINGHFTEDFDEGVRRIQEFEASQGVVLKVKRELPVIGYKGIISSVVQEIQYDEQDRMVKAGYEPVVSLLEPVVERTVRESR